MHSLPPQTALGAQSAQQDVIGTLSLTEVPDVAIASVAARKGHEAACAKTLQKLLGATPPGPGEMTGTTPYAAIWMAQDQWLLCAPLHSHEDIASLLKEEFGADASITEQTDGWACFDISGAAMHDMFERLCPAPVRSMQTGHATRTTIHHIGCYLMCQDGAFRVMAPRSSAGSLYHALIEAARSVS